MPPTTISTIAQVGKLEPEPELVVVPVVAGAVVASVFVGPSVTVCCTVVCTVAVRSVVTVTVVGVVSVGVVAVVSVDAAVATPAANAATASTTTMAGARVTGLPSQRLSRVHSRSARPSVGCAYPSDRYRAGTGP